MPKEKQSRIVKNISAYIDAKNIRENSPARITNGTMLHYINGGYVTKERFFELTQDPNELLEPIETRLSND